MRVLISPDKFKGSLTALEAAQAIARGILRACPEAVAVPMPIADGGEGTAETICAALGGTWISLQALDPLGREIEARYAWLEEDIAAIDMCEASGLWRLSPNERDLLRASTFGTGQLIADALQRGAKKILIGLGGSATSDGGIGMAAALGFQFFGCAGDRLEAIPANLADLSRIRAPSAPIGAKVVALCDVCNPLTGERGASRMFGPQKGACPRAVMELDAGLASLADLVARDLGSDHRNTPGSGAAGGLGFGLLSFCGAELCAGFDALAEILHLEDQVAASDLVITGEGRLDAQTLEGKGPAGIAALARKHGKPVIAFAGAVDEEPRLGGVFQEIFAITPTGMPIGEAMQAAASLLEDCAVRAAREFAMRGHRDA